jgi:hypothetical protein
LANKEEKPATPKKVNKRPAALISYETLEEQAKVIDERKKHALMDTHEVILNDGWKKQQALWSSADHETRCSIVYGMILHDGAINVRDITRFFAIKTKDLEPYAVIMDMAKAALKLKIQRNQISIGLQREDSAPLKFNLQKQFAEQVNDPAHEGVESVQSGPPTVVFNQTTGANDDIKAELEAAVHSAIAIAGVKNKSVTS